MISHFEMHGLAAADYVTRAALRSASLLTWRHFRREHDTRVGPAGSFRVSFYCSRNREYLDDRVVE